MTDEPRESSELPRIDDPRVPRPRSPGSLDEEELVHLRELAQHTNEELEAERFAWSQDRDRERMERVRPRVNDRMSRWIIRAIVLLLAAAAMIMIWSGVSIWQKQRRDSQKVLEQYGRHPLVVEQIGASSQCHFSWLETASPKCPEPRALAFRISGPQGTGFLYVLTPTGEVSDATWAGLRRGEQFWPLENR